MVWISTRLGRDQHGHLGTGLWFSREQPSVYSAVANFSGIHDNNDGRWIDNIWVIDVVLQKP